MSLLPPAPQAPGIVLIELEFSSRFVDSNDDHGRSNIRATNTIAIRFWEPETESYTMRIEHSRRFIHYQRMWRMCHTCSDTVGDILTL